MEGACDIGQHVTLVDEIGVKHDALVTAVHGPECINAIYVSKDATKHDQYGRQIERLSSLQKKSQYTAHGRYYYEVVGDVQSAIDTLSSSM